MANPERRGLLARATRLAAAGWFTTGPAHAADTVHDLHGLARLRLPARFRFRGLDTRHRDLTPAEQLARHAGGPLVFQFDADARNSWGGHALDPLLLNLVLFDPAAPGDRPERGFSITRYFSPTGGTISLDDPRWQRRSEGAGAEQRIWRTLAMDDHFGAPPEPRWALSVYDARRALRLDLFAWRSKLTREAAEALLRDALAGLDVLPTRDAFFRQGGSAESRQAALREQHVAAFFAALAPLRVPRPAPGAVSIGPDAAAWLDDDGQALRALVLLARVPPAALASLDAEGRPRLAWGDGARAERPQRPPELLYWHSPSSRWRKTRIERDSSPADWPLLPIEAGYTARLGAPEDAHMVLQFHAYQPPVLDDALEVRGFLADAERWREALRAGALRGVPGGGVATGALR
jgi:hypothetical protein